VTPHAALVVASWLILLLVLTTTGFVVVAWPPSAATTREPEVMVWCPWAGCVYRAPLGADCGRHDPFDQEA